MNALVKGPNYTLPVFVLKSAAPHAAPHAAHVTHSGAGVASMGHNAHTKAGEGTHAISSLRPSIADSEVPMFAHASYSEGTPHNGPPFMMNR